VVPRGEDTTSSATESFDPCALPFEQAVTDVDREQPQLVEVRPPEALKDAILPVIVAQEVARGHFDARQRC
jgi:hypothetical protein